MSCLQTVPINSPTWTYSVRSKRNTNRADSWTDKINRRSWAKVSQPSKREASSRKNKHSWSMKHSTCHRFHITTKKFILNSASTRWSPRSICQIFISMRTISRHSKPHTRLINCQLPMCMRLFHQSFLILRLRSNLHTRMLRTSTDWSNIFSITIRLFRAY